MGSMAHQRDELLTRKRDLFAAIHLLEDDRRDGTVDETAYRSARERYELEAAAVLERLDEVRATSGVGAEIAEPRQARQDGRTGTGLPAPTSPSSSSRSLGWPLGVAVGTGAVLAALVLFLVTSLNGRGSEGSITGEQPAAAATPAAPTPAKVVAAQNAVRKHPRSVTALIGLGNAYLDAGRSAEADTTYKKAMQVAPRRPEAATLHALVLSSSHHDADALRVLAGVERANPTYARAWLLDGLVASRLRSGYPRAIAAWQHFLTIGGNTPVSAQVRAWLSRLQKAEKGSR